MSGRTIDVDGVRLPVHSLNTLVVGSGAAALNAAVALHDRGVRDIAIVTERWGGGTSANAGSDKQTYYKLSQAGGAPDSARLLAEDLFAGGSMHGDIALCEAQHSAQAFYHLVQIGVPFPHDRFGGFTGYQTDHDRRGRATSAGPLTSHLMVKALSRVVGEKQIEVLAPYQVVALLTDERDKAPRAIGAVALDLQSCASGSPEFVLFNAVNIVLATGGPGGLYLDSVYPADQTGSIGVALRTGAVAQNLTESQFGLASIGPRWNVSGSYQQAIPRYVSTDAAGGDPREFLHEGFADAGAMGTAIFRKGYQWPFDPSRIHGGGSSLVDLLVHRERAERGRRVYLDFTRNFDGGTLGSFAMDALDPEARTYLERCGAVGATPIDRLAAINQPAIDLYGRHGIDLAHDWLEIAVCAQHNNGGLRGNIWWESNIAGLFPVGEVNGSHGVRRPGGASLNAGQVGSLRAAMYIAARRQSSPPPVEAFADLCRDAIGRTLRVASTALGNRESGRRSPDDIRREIQRRMSLAGAHIRDAAVARREAIDAWALLAEYERVSWADAPAALPAVFRNHDLCVAHAVYLEAIAEYLERGGQSRGSFLVVDTSGDPAISTDDRSGRFVLETAGSFVDTHILEIALAGNGETRKAWVPVRPIPDADTWYESVWKAYRSGSFLDEMEKPT
jgi:succinate dehydrogenase/fumarate reductase flavoprotein subunit